ncbi:Com1 regulatory protein [Pleurostoma richardsiae]|uniref:E3 ubiquitin-protein ligase n=1 Tax=Pleurostoma richardsiae TaxID=41990 RepID=A0AA38S6V4_9PEZI|nr:Com1 regulatory protein [Pleurostoma richardsiae]
MPFRIPEAGLQLESSADAVATLPLQAFAITLSDSVLEDMIQCVQNGEDIQLSLGGTPSLLYGSSVHRLSGTDSPELDLYLTDPSEFPKRAERLPNPTMSILNKPHPLLAAAQKREKEEREKNAPLKKDKGSSTKPSARSRDMATDPAIAALQNSLAQANAEKLENSTTVANVKISDKGVGKKRNKAKLLSSGKGALANALNRSQPASPALSGIGSPSLAPTLSASQQAAIKAKQQRSPIIHELAVKDRTFQELRDKCPGDSDADFKTALEKVADFDDRSQKYVLKKMYWKELDVFRYRYASNGDRQLAIDNAVKQFDRMRLGASEPEWQKLLPKEERGKGKCLSKLQATIARGPPAPVARTPKITVQDAEDSSAGSGKNGDGDRSATESKKAKGGEAMVRSSSQSSQTKKKVTGSEAQAKRLLSNSKKPTPQKTSPSKTSASAKGGAKDKKEGRVLSKEFISDSDSSSSEEAPLSTTVPRSRLVEKPKEKEVREKEVHVRVPPPKPKPAPKEPIKAQVIAKPAKRTREDDDSSSSSGTPLSKRFKTRPEIKAAAPLPPKHRTSDASQNSRGTASSGVSMNGKSKNTSPAKSSPLASSPPTNASDLDNAAEEQQVAAVNSKKRKAAANHEDADSRSKQRLMAEAVDLSRAFKVYYKRYEIKHYEVVGMDDPPEGAIMDLMEMRQRLEDMKRDIHRKVAMAG